MSKNISVFGILNTRNQAEATVDRLRAAGFRAADISLLMPENIGNKEIGHEKSSKAPEGAAAGGATGALAGGVFGWLVGIGALAIPGVGPLIAAGPIMAALAGMGAGAALGGVGGALLGVGIPEYEAKRYEGRVKAGGVLISIHCDNDEWSNKAKTLLDSMGAQDVSSTSQSSADYESTEKPVLSGPQV